jgi:3'(2'), 5'-bisphosphate nucleotidase
MVISNKKQDILNIAIQAGEICLKYFNKISLEVSYKEDNSPVTSADNEVSEFLKRSLLDIFSDFSVLSEEDNFDHQCKAIQNSNLIVIDPIDGTSAFVKGDENFTVNICIISNNNPIFSLIYQPFTGLIYFADKEFSYKISSFTQNKREVKVYNAKKREGPLRVICTKRKTELAKIYNLIGSIKAEFITISSSIKFCHMSENAADIYPRMSRIKFWDVAAGFHIARNAGLKISGKKEQKLMDLVYRKNYLLEIINDEFFIDEFIITNSSNFKNLF